MFLKSLNLFKIAKGVLKIKTEIGKWGENSLFSRHTIKEVIMEESTTNTQIPTVTSFMTRAANVFASPAELYSEVATQPVKASSWSIPYIVSMLLALVFTYALFSNPILRQQIYDMQERTWKEQVASGKMTQGQYEQMTNGMESSGPVMFMIIGGGTSVIMISLVFFGLALIVWLIVRVGLKATASYGKILEILGLASIISIAGTIVTLLLMNAFNSMYATPGASLLILSSFDPASTAHRFIAAVNIFTIWESVISGLGIAKISGKPYSVGVGVMVGLWVIWVIVSSLLGLGVR